MNYKERQLKLVELILEHRIFADFFDYMIETGKMPDINDIQDKMRELNVCSEQLIKRRSSSVYGWLKWVFNLTNI